MVKTPRGAQGLGLQIAQANRILTTGRGAAAPILSAAPAFRFDLSSLFEYYSMLNVSAFARYLGINETLMRQYKKGMNYFSDLSILEQIIPRI